ncbi:hypothetical protein BDP67DRAFT_258183 [Colletotrichum lupini]|nr:hypothetical protein BDP67DRAFT_258183 [Colletotrichum lupini]
MRERLADFLGIVKKAKKRKRVKKEEKKDQKKKACERSTAAQIPQTLTRRRSFPTFQPHHHQPDRFPAGDEDPRCNRHPTSQSHSASIPNSSIAKTLSLSLSVPCNQRTCQNALDAGQIWPNACVSSFSRFGRIAYTSAAASSKTCICHIALAPMAPLENEGVPFYICLPLRPTYRIGNTVASECPEKDRLLPPSKALRHVAVPI